MLGFDPLPVDCRMRTRNCFERSQCFACEAGSGQRRARHHLPRAWLTWTRSGSTVEEMSLPLALFLELPLLVNPPTRIVGPGVGTPHGLEAPHLPVTPGDDVALLNFWSSIWDVVIGECLPGVLLAKGPSVTTSIHSATAGSYFGDRWMEAKSLLNTHRQFGRL